MGLDAKVRKALMLDAVVWLRQRGVPNKRIADALGAKSDSQISNYLAGRSFPSLRYREALDQLVIDVRAEQTAKEAAKFVAEPVLVPSMVPSGVDGVVLWIANDGTIVYSITPPPGHRYRVEVAPARD